MYRIINQNIDLILGSVNEDLDIHTYLTLLNIFQNVDVAQDAEFQSKYCRYWRLFGAGLSQNFRSAYFELMEGLRGRPIPSIGEVTRILYDVPSNKSGRKTLQFSFASKLLHTLDPHRPIYDSMVATFYRFMVPAPNKSFDVRLQSFLSFYGFLIIEYKKVLSNGLIQRAIAHFRHRFSVPDEYTDEKIIDTLVWRAMDLRKKDRLFADQDQKSAKWLGNEKGPVGTPAEPFQPNTSNKEGEAMIIGTVTSQGVYADGKDIYELYISADSSDRLPHEYGKEKPIDIRIGDFIYEDSVHQTKKGIVWVSSVLFKKGSRREQVRLVDALAKINVKKRDKIRIKSSEEGIYLLEKM